MLIVSILWCSIHQLRIGFGLRFDYGLDWQNKLDIVHENGVIYDTMMAMYAPKLCD